MNTQTIVTALSAVREQKPLVLNITNYVVMNNTANGLLAMGASPIMAHSRAELAEMMAFSGALVINIGTLDSVWIERMMFAVEQANQHGKPVVLDPVGCGASSLRTETSRRIAEAAEQLIIRGNASEIIALAGTGANAEANSKGVDALDASEAAVEAARYLVRYYRCSVVISGKIDIIVTDNSEFRLHNGHSMMPFVTGMGCTLSALTGAFAAVGETTGLAAAAVLGVAGEIAAEQSQGPGSLQLNLLDALYRLDAETLMQRLRMEQP
ncbi:hydroxyethylthiazole kinase [Oceanisphaera arctica]|uniref:Hydroxyethylthiazole kinase n=1 Tax=Oceanisphaera arctica TaxID=641510 RepID=A0A2P5TJZ8_9GAMM|nr:hydroxyethylthiazole kinase [Oceanisphaera arctica]PPL15378.1 hydroxyethylthiazole kinase [Oceanisphaera arctica]GHA28967.1 hydroxyethylthiazole kinase [Oceanisphaera arctica]